jgi:hypothetical protein
MMYQEKSGNPEYEDGKELLGNIDQRFVCRMVVRGTKISGRNARGGGERGDDM